MRAGKLAGCHEGASRSLVATSETLALPEEINRSFLTLSGK